MSDDGKTTDPPADDGDGKGSPLKLGDIRELVTGVVEEVLSKKDSDTAPRQAGRRVVESKLDRNSAIEDAVEAAVKQLKEQEERTRKESELHETVKVLKEKTDRPPVERSKLHKFMGWGE
jgi:hypothetical protein